MRIPDTARTAAATTLVIAFSLLPRGVSAADEGRQAVVESMRARLAEQQTYRTDLELKIKRRAMTIAVDVKRHEGDGAERVQVDATSQQRPWVLWHPRCAVDGSGPLCTGGGRRRP